MHIAKSTAFFLMFVLMLSILISNVVNVINVDSYATTEQSQQHDSQQQSEPKKYQIADSTDNLIWFLQISDIHISIFHDPTRITAFREFCNETVNVYKPYVVLASGDLTDAKTADHMGSRQILGEWINYKRVLDETNVTNRTIWLDVRGNHDNFNVINIKSPENYYTNYSIQGRKHPRSYKYEIKTSSERYSFIAVDACLQPGPKRPFNFVGSLDEDEVAHIQNLSYESRNNNAEYIIWFGHYPTSCIISQCDGGVRSLLGRFRESMVYLCGHYHTLGGAVPNMYTLQQAGFLELELADWKDNRMYRLAAMDHGQFSFVDVKHKDWPIALITNPKHAQFAMPQRENIDSIIDSTHIRILVFSPAAILKVLVKVDNNSWLNCEHVKGPLYVAKWNPRLYLSGVHKIQVFIADAEDREKTFDQPFSLDGTRIPFNILPRLILMSNATNIFKIFFGVTLVSLILPLCLLRFLHVLQKEKRMRKSRAKIQFFHNWWRKLWILSTVDRIFFPLVLSELYLKVGPWIIGEVIDNHVGVVFAWGTFIGNSFLPGSFTYAYGYFQLSSFHLPLTLLLAHRIDKRLQYLEKPLKNPLPLWRLYLQHIPFILLILMQLCMVYFFWLAYGTLATLLCPLRTWSIFLALILWHQVHRMPLHCMRSAAKVWYTNISLS